MSSNSGPLLRLEPLAGPTLKTISVDPTTRPAGTPWVMGRSSTSDLPLQDPEGVVSRSHASVSYQGRLWFVKDLGSRHGSYINGTKLQPQAMAPLADGDRLRIGPWTFRIAMGESHTTTQLAATNDDRGNTTGSVVRKLDVEGLNLDVRKRLDLIIKVAGSLSGAESESQISSIALDALQRGTGFPRAAVLRLAGQGESVEVIAQIIPGSGAATGGGGGGSAGTADPTPVPGSVKRPSSLSGFLPTKPDTRFSLSLLQEASKGETVYIDGADRPNYGQSIMSLEISSAVCAPIMIDGAADAFLYVDARGREVRFDPSVVFKELVSYCDTIARLVGLAFANLYRKRLEKDEERQKIELEAAREVQILIMPPSKGTVAGVGGDVTLSYEIASIPGRFVAGDLFDFFPIDESRAALLLGDVAGKGVAAGLVMANVQGQLKGLLRQSGDPATALREVNRAVADYSERASRTFSTIFLSLWCGVFDLRARTLKFVDAGHGHWLVRPPGGAIAKHTCHGALPIGVDAAYPFESETIELTPGLRLYIYSDGVVEQLGQDNQQFGVERTIDVLSAVRELRPGETHDVTSEISSLVEAVRTHAGFREGTDRPFADDFTVAVVDIR